MPNRLVIRPTFFWISIIGWLCFSTLPSGAQCPAEEPDISLERYEFPPGVAADPPLDSREACPSWRWVAIKAEDEASCPVPEEVDGGSWKRADYLFSAPRPTTLEPYCLYQVKEGDEEARRRMNRNLETLVAERRLLEAESGCAAVAPSAARLSSSRPEIPPTTKILHDQFYEQAQALAGWRAFRHSAPSPDCGPSVRLAVIDTQPTGTFAGKRNSEHGYAISRIIQRLVCQPMAEGSDSQHCAAEVHPRLALAITHFDWAKPEKPHTVFDFEHGGRFGTIDELAVAVWEELRTWREMGESQLVMNLSVGWVGERFGGLEEDVRDMPVPVRALYRALEVASCRGALVVAAAGNRVGGPTIEEGPLFPGGWERRAAPTRAQCGKILGDDENQGTDSTEPLVYAVGGVHADGSPLVNARPASEPARVAYGDHAVLLPEGGQPAEFFTGSSVSTAVVSAAAATVWHHRPELDRAELMELLHRSGRDTGRTADVYASHHSNTAAPPVRIVGVCPAVAHACSKSHACPEIGELRCSRPEPPVDLRTDCDGIDCEGAVKLTVSIFDQLLTDQSFCAQPTLHYQSARGQPTYSCPGRQSFGIRAHPWTNPQPMDDPCVGCSMDDPTGPGTFRTTQKEDPGLGMMDKYRLTLRIDPEWCPQIQSAILTLGGERFHLDIASDLLACASGAVEPFTIVVDGFDAQLVESTDFPHPTLHWTTKVGGVESPIFVTR